MPAASENDRMNFAASGGTMALPRPESAGATSRGTPLTSKRTPGLTRLDFSSLQSSHSASPQAPFRSTGASCGIASRLMPAGRANLWWWVLASPLPDRPPALPVSAPSLPRGSEPSACCGSRSPKLWALASPLGRSRLVVSTECPYPKAGTAPRPVSRPSPSALPNRTAPK